LYEYQGQIHAEPFGATGVCFPPIPHSEQDHQRQGFVHRDSILLHRVQQNSGVSHSLPSFEVIRVK
jgi:hypothetical protein